VITLSTFLTFFDITFEKRKVLFFGIVRNIENVFSNNGMQQFCTMQITEQNDNNNNTSNIH